MGGGGGGAPGLVYDRAAKPLPARRSGGVQTALGVCFRGGLVTLRGVGGEGEGTGMLRRRCVQAAVKMAVT